MPHAPPDCVVCVWVSVGVFAQVSEHASFHVCAVKCRSVLCVSFTLLPPLPSCRNAVETLTHQTQPQEDGRAKGDTLACCTLYVETAEPDSAFFM